MERPNSQHLRGYQSFHMTLLNPSRLSWPPLAGGREVLEKCCLWKIEVSLVAWCCHPRESAIEGGGWGEGSCWHGGKGGSERSVRGPGVESGEERSGRGREGLTLSGWGISDVENGNGWEDAWGS